MITCQFCHLGNLQPTSATYANWHSGQFVLVPRMPMWQCDICAQCEVDEAALRHLRPLLGPITRPNAASPNWFQPHTNTDRSLDETHAQRDRRGA